jgi:hypothetical protein
MKSISDKIKKIKIHTTVKKKKWNKGQCRKGHTFFFQVQ